MGEYKDMKILVTGGQGFIGHNLIRNLLERFKAIQIISVDNLSTGSEDNRWNKLGITYLNFDIVYQDLKNIEWIPDCIFHIAATARIQPSFDAPLNVLHNNVEGTLNVLEFARRNGNIPVVFAGSSSVHSGHYKNPYTFSKWMCEEACMMYSKIYGLPTTITRFYNVYGPSMIDGSSPYATALSVFENRIKRNESIQITSDGEQRRDFTHVDDICDGLIACIGRERDRAEIFELGRGENYSMNEIADMFLRKYPDTIIEYIPERPGEAKDTLTLSEGARRELNYHPNWNVEDYIKEL